MRLPSIVLAPRGLACAAAVVGLLLAGLAPDAHALRRRQTVVHEDPGHLTFTSPQSNPVALTSDGSLAFVAATTSDRVDVINAANDTVIGSVDVGIDPVSVAVLPGDTELWVANHVSDTVSVVDIVPTSPTFLHVIETVQDVDANGVTRFDEPVGIAFKEDGSQAYVALSSRNDVAIVDTADYAVIGRLHLTAQEPRALAVRGNRLYVAAFESNNQSELSICEAAGEDPDPNDCTLDIDDVILFVGISPNLPGLVKDIDLDPDSPDRDLFVWDLGTGLSGGEAPTQTVSGVGTLLYGLAVSSTGTVFVTQADARNAVNGNDGGATNPSDVNGDGVVNLADLENRMFLNRITEIDCGGGGSCGSPIQHELEEAPGQAVSLPLATPYGVAIDAGDDLLVATAAGSSRVFSWDVQGGSGPAKVLSSLDVGSIPRGVALDSAAGLAYVLNTLGNSVSVVSVDTNPASPSFGALALVATVPVGNDPTPDAVRRGRIAFNNADASTSGTFSCASCHPDGNTDQLLWRIGGACFLNNCTPGEDEPRSTMPVRGLRDTVPLHWDGSLGDPFGGGNGAVGFDGSVPPSCTAGDGHDCFLHLVDASLAGVMCDQTGSCPAGGTILTAQEIDDMATFLASVSYPPARGRRMDDDLTTSAAAGFEDFFMDQNGLNQPNTCADSDAGCHELPLGTANNAETLGGFDAPTMRGMTDRFLQFSIGITNATELLIGLNDGACTPALLGLFGACAPPNPIPFDPADGFTEASTFGAAFGVFTPVYGVGPTDILEMFEEASTGHSGSLGRQVTLNVRTTDPTNPPGPPGPPLDATQALLAALEAADDRGVVNLRGKGLRNLTAVTISYDPPSNASQPYKVNGLRMDRATLIAEAQAGTLLATLTGHLRAGTSESTPQPLIAPEGAQCGAGTGSTGDPALPNGSTITIEARHVSASDTVFLNGLPTSATISVLGSATACSPVETTTQRIQIAGLPLTGATDVLQVQAASGLLSNEMPLP